MNRLKIPVYQVDAFANRVLPATRRPFAR